MKKMCGRKEKYKWRNWKGASQSRIQKGREKEAEKERTNNNINNSNRNNNYYFYYHYLLLLYNRTSHNKILI